MDKYNQAHRNQQKNIITTLTELKKRKLNSGKLCCTNEVKIKFVLLYKNREMSVKQLCKIYHLHLKTVYSWIKNYDRLL
ncbi:helix-turn-helix domain-containing protein [Enterococcus hirae]|nr:helix-turn-helix domain-containing protein [Enterococcus hirae]